MSCAASVSSNLGRTFRSASAAALAKAAASSSARCASFIAAPGNGTAAPIRCAAGLVAAGANESLLRLTCMRLRMSSAGSAGSSSSAAAWHGRASILSRDGDEEGEWRETHRVARLGGRRRSADKGAETRLRTTQTTGWQYNSHNDSRRVRARGAVGRLVELGLDELHVEDQGALSKQHSSRPASSQLEAGCEHTFAGMPSRAESPYASCGGTTSSRRPPFLIPLIPCSQP